MKVLHCRDLGFDCDAVVRAESEDEVLQQVAQHARTEHDMQEVPDEVVQQAREAIREE